MQWLADEPRQVRKEATAVSPNVCRGQPSPLIFKTDFVAKATTLGSFDGMKR